MSQKDNSKTETEQKNFVTGFKRILTGFFFFSCCLLVYFAISALFSNFLYNSPSVIVQEKQEIPKVQENQENKPYLTQHKSIYQASDILFTAYFSQHDPMDDLLAAIQGNYFFDKEALQDIKKIHTALKEFLMQEISEKNFIYADSNIHFAHNAEPAKKNSRTEEAYPFVVFQLIHEETPEYMYYIGEDNYAFYEKMKKFLKDQKLDCSLYYENSFYYLMYKGKITHVVRLRELQSRVGIFSLLNSQNSYISIVLDDAGENLSLAKECMDLPYPVILSVWPQATHATAIAVLAHEKGLPVFLHQPMEALQRNGKDVEIGENGLYTTMSYEQMRDILRKNIRQLPYVQGMNNHMGSKFTLTDEAILKFYRAIREIKPYFLVLDSLTVTQSKLYKIGKENDFMVSKRDIFIDNQKDKNKILKELERAYDISKKHKRVIVLGHVRKETVQALKNWKAYMDENLIFSLPTMF